MNLPDFWYGTSLNFDSYRGTNHTLSGFLSGSQEISLVDHILDSIIYRINEDESTTTNFMHVERWHLNSIAVGTYG